MDRNQHDRETGEELIRAAEVEPEGPPAAGDGEPPGDSEADRRGDLLVPEHMESTFAPCLRGNEAEEPSDQGLDGQRVDDQDQSKERCQHRYGESAQEGRRELHGSEDPGSHVVPANEVGRKEHHVGDERYEREEAFGEHRASSYRERVSLDVELLGRRRAAHEAVPSRDRAARDRDEQDGPNRPEDPLRIEQERAGRHGYWDVREWGRERTDEKQDDRAVCRIESEVVRRLDEGRRRQHRGGVQDDRANERPEGDVPHPERPRGIRGEGGEREQNAHIDADYDEGEPDHGHGEDVHLPAIEELTAKQPRKENPDGRDERAPELVPERGDEGDESGRDDD